MKRVETQGAVVATAGVHHVGRKHTVVDSVFQLHTRQSACFCAKRADGITTSWRDQSGGGRVCKALMTIIFNHQHRRRPTGHQLIDKCQGRHGGTFASR